MTTGLTDFLSNDSHALYGSRAPIVSFFPARPSLAAIDKWIGIKSFKGTCLCIVS